MTTSTQTNTSNLIRDLSIEVDTNWMIRFIDLTDQELNHFLKIATHPIYGHEWFHIGYGIVMTQRIALDFFLNLPQNEKTLEALDYITKIMFPDDTDDETDYSSTVSDDETDDSSTVSDDDDYQYFPIIVPQFNRPSVSISNIARSA